MGFGFRARRLKTSSPLSAFIALIALGLAGTAELTAQEQATTGVIRGRVVDPTGSPVAAAQVMIRHDQTGLVRQLATNNSGVFVATLLPVGSYDVTVRAIGQFGDIQNQDVIVRLGEAVNLVLAFQPVALTEITVTGEAVLVDPTDVTSSQRLAEEVVDGLPNNGRNFLEYTQLTPGVTIVQGPDGDELSISGQRGIFNNVIVDGADFNNPFFGEQRGGQRPAFTFNQDAIEEMVVVAQGATAEYGRSSGGFVNVLTKSGTNEFEGSAHYFGQFDGISAEFPSDRGGGKPDFTRSQFGLTLGGPIVRDKAFFFLAYDQQEASETKQFDRAATIANFAELQKLENFLQTQWPGQFDNEFGPIERTDDNKALIAKLDFNLSDKHKLSLKYNYTWSEQRNGTFDVDAWGASSNGIEKDFSHAVNGMLSSQLSSTVSNEFRFQWAREDRPRGYEGPLVPGAPLPAQPAFADIGGQPFPDTGMDFVDGFRIGLPFFLPIDPGVDKRFQVLDNVSFLVGDHLFKVGAEWNRTQFEQQFIGFAAARYIFSSVDGFINYVTQGPDWIECIGGPNVGMSGIGIDCGDNEFDWGPLQLYLQSATVPPFSPSELGRQDATVNELGFFIQDTWKPVENVTLNLGVRWEGTWHPDQFIQPSETFYASLIGQPGFPSDGTIPDDLNNFQPRFGLAWDVNNDGRDVVRLNAGSYYARIPMLVFAQHRTTNAAFQQIIFRNSFTGGKGFLPTPPEYGQLIDPAGASPFLPDIQVASTDLQLPRTWSFSGGFEHLFSNELAASITYQHARTDNLFRFINRTDPVFGDPFGVPAIDGFNGIGNLITTESTAFSRYNGITLGAKGRGAFNGVLTYEANYTLSWDKSDDDNERDPFVYKYARADALDREYHWSDRDRRHQLNGYFLFDLPGDVKFNNILRFASAQPVSENCTTGGRAAAPADRICADGSILLRNTLRKDNGLFTWDLRISREFEFGSGQTIEPILEVFNLTNADNFLDTATGSLLFDFSGTIRSGLGDTRRAQLGVRFHF
jgi:hypothetical protein